MNRRDALKTIGTVAGTAGLARLLPGCNAEVDEAIAVSQLAPGYPPNFQLLKSNSSWRTSWTQIVPGRFSGTSPYSGLLFYDSAAGLAEIYSCDGSGNMSLLGQTTGLGSTYTHVVAGFFENSGLSSVFFYDALSGA